VMTPSETDRIPHWRINNGKDGKTEFSNHLFVSYYM
jgi:hypothetical protein